MLLGACSNEELLADRNPNEERTISLTAAISSEPTTRIALMQQENNTIALTWETDDEIELLFKQGTIEIKQTVTLTSISNDGKRAQFDIVIPNEINEGAFDLYGVYGGGGLSDTNPTLATLPQYLGLASSLNTPWYNNPSFSFSSVQDRKDVMLYFASKGVQTTNPKASVAFKHLGSLFSVTVMNTGATNLNNLDFTALHGVDENGNWDSSGNWAYNGDFGEKNFDLVNEIFLDVESGGSYITFETESNTLASGESITFWGWYPPLPNVNWPRLSLELVDTDGEVMFETVNPHPARNQPLSAGKAYYFYADFDGAQLRFIGIFTDPRDGNNYQTVTIDNQVWIAENLKYLPSVVGPTIFSDTSPYYYVYDYEGTDVEEAKNEENYTTYGVLYNWTAAMAGSASSNANPSTVQGVCPTGWHLPSEAEWDQLIDYLGGVYVAGGKLKEIGLMNWQDPNAGATNEAGFKALPGGYSGWSTFEELGSQGFWWSATENSSEFSWSSEMNYDDDGVNVQGNYKQLAYSVRCVRD